MSLKVMNLKRARAWHSYARAVIQLVHADLVVFRHFVFDGVVDTIITTVLLVGTMTYIMPLLGTVKEYGPFVGLGAIATSCLFNMYGIVTILVSDIRGDQIILYRLSLPVPSALVFVARAIVSACKVAVNGFVTAFFGIGILVIGGRFSLEYFSFGKFLLFSIFLFLFVGFFTILMGSLVKNLDRIGSVWTRMIYPLWFLGGAQFSWQVLYSFSPSLAYLSLANPFLYLMEGIHSATLNPAHYLNFWACLGMMIIFTIGCGFLGIRRLKKQLDWV